jgi:hypothetical protein
MTGTALAMGRPYVLSRFQFTALLLGIIGAGVGWVGVMWNSIEKRPEAILDGEVLVETRPWTPPNQPDSPPRLLPSVVVTNRTGERWENVSVSINKAFVHYHFQPLAPGETLVAPLERFVTKGGNVNFRPSTQEVHRITVFAQLPSNERAVLNRGVEATSTGWSVKPWSGGR